MSPTAAAAAERRFRRSVLAWRDGTEPREFRWRATSDPYAVLIGEVLLQRTSSSHVAAVYDEFLRRWPGPQALASARVSSIRSVIAPLGLPNRAQKLKALGAALVQVGDVPLDPAALDRLPAIGPYAAHAVPVFAAGRDLPLVDWVIARVMRRYFGLPSLRRPNADAELWELATRLARKGRGRDLWLGVLDLGAAYCRSRPKCAACPIRLSCAHAEQVANVGSPH